MSSLVVPDIEGLLARYPDIDIDAISDIREANLTRGEVDIAVRMVRPQSGELVSRVVGKVEYGLYGTERLREVPEPLRVFIGFRREARFWLAQQLEKYVANRRYVFRSNDIVAIEMAASVGLGIALLPRFLADETSNLVPLPGLSEVVTSPIYLVMQRDARQSPRVRVVADYLALALREKN